MKIYYLATVLIIFSCILAVAGFSRKIFVVGNSSLIQQTAQQLKHFAEGIIETSGDEYNPAFTPDGKTVYFTRRIDRKGNETIMFSQFENGKWTTAKTADFSGKFYDKKPFVAPDGKRIFFASTRPNGRDVKDNFDIWFVEKTRNGWSEAKNAGANVNTSGYDNYPSVARDGTLYFGSCEMKSAKTMICIARVL